MYQKHWSFGEYPFENTPNPKFFFEAEHHREALSRFQYLVSEKKACGLLTGVYGCGKTLVLHALMKAMAPAGSRFSIVNNPRLDDLGILRLILYGFRKNEVPSDKAQLLMELERFVVGVADDGKHSVIVVDEAHAIENENVFEELRLLLNFQNETRSFVTLLLVGQPELKPRVEANKQLNQRVNLRFHLGPLSYEEAVRYTHHRLKVAGAARPDSIFPDKVIEAIHKQSGGIPRWINQIAHMSLLVAFSRGSKSVSVEMVQEAVQDLGGFS